MDLYRDKNILVVGLGVSGQAAAYYLLKNGAKVVGVDRNVAELMERPLLISMRALGLDVRPDAMHDLHPYDLIIISPGIPPTHVIYAEAIRLKKMIWGEVELGCRSITNKIIGITGTNGKTTVTLLVAHILNQSGKKARALGNVGTPLTQEILSISSDEILVLELSSFQLETLSQSIFETGVILNITPDHLDRYKGIESYAAAKMSLEDCMKKNSHFYIEEKTYCEFGYLLKNKNHLKYGYSPQNYIYTDMKDVFVAGQKTFSLPNAFKGKVSHDLENVMASYALCRDMGISSYEFLNALQSFQKPPHRIEFVLEKKGVSYYDDSKGTNIDAVIRAVDSLKGPVILIAGGVDKGSPYNPWLGAFADKVKYICAIGQAAKKMQEQLSSEIPVQIFSSLEHAVKHAEGLAQPGDTVLLSPGCSSYDMFRDYAHRGEEFQRIVKRDI